MKVNEKRLKIHEKRPKRKYVKFLEKYALFSTLSIQKILPNAFSYKLSADLFIYDNIPVNSNKELSHLLSIQNNYKKILSVISDHSLDLIIAKVESIESDYTPIEFLSKKLQSLGNSDAFQLSKTLENYENLFKKIEKTPFQDYDDRNLKFNEEYKAFCSKNAEITNKFKDTPSIIWKLKHNGDSKKFEISEIGFNLCFVRFVSENESNFIDYLMRNGFPDCIHMQESYFKFIDIMLNQTFFKDANVAADLNCYLVSDTYPKIPANLKFQMNSFTHENYKECFMIDYFEINKKNIEIIEKCKEEKKLAKIMMKKFQRKERIFMNDGAIFYEDSFKFLNCFYKNIQICKHNDENHIRCKVREIEDRKEN